MPPERAAEVPRFHAPAGGILDAGMRQVFDRDGVLVLEGFASKDDCAALMDRARTLVDGFDPAEVQSVFSSRTHAHSADAYFETSGDKIRFFLEEEAVDAEGRLNREKTVAVNKIGHALHDLDPVFEAFSRRPALGQVVRALGMAQPLLLQSMYIFKQPGIGGEVVCHQDSTFLYTDPPSVVGLWFALEDATVDNGCLWGLPGQHRAGLKSRYRRLDGGLAFEVYDRTPWPEEARVPLEVAAGTLIVLHGQFPHLSGVNRSPRSRHAYTLHVIDGAARYPADNWLVRGRDMPLRGFSARD